MPVGIAVLFVGLIPAWNEFSTTQIKRPPFSPDNYAVAQWAAENLPAGTRLAFVNMPWVEAYWVHMAIQRQPRTTIRLPGGGRESYGYADWQYDARTGDYAYIQVLGADPLADTEVLFRSGDVAVLRRLRQPSAIRGDVARIRPDGSGDLPAPIGSLYWLTSARASDTRLRPGSTVWLDLDVVPRANVDRDTLLAAHLRSREGKVIATAEIALDVASAKARTSDSTPSRIRLSLVVPANATPGVYDVELFALSIPGYKPDPAYFGDSVKPVQVMIGALAITPDTVGTQPPAGLERSGARLGDSIALYGYSFATGSSGDEQTITGTLVWQATGSLVEDYTVFVHVLDSSGKLIGQSDSQPMGGAFPTSVWQAGEYVPDTFQIKLPGGIPPGEYRIVVGMYLLRTLERLPVAAGSGTAPTDHVELGAVAIGR